MDIRNVEIGLKTYKLWSLEDWRFLTQADYVGRTLRVRRVYWLDMLITETSAYAGRTHGYMGVRPAWAKP